MRNFSTFLVLSLTVGLGGCVLSVNDGEDETGTTTASGTTATETGTTTTETGSETGTTTETGEAEASTGDGDGDSTSSETGTTGDGDGDCELYSDPAMGGCCEGEQPLGVQDLDGAFCAPACDAAMMCPASSVGTPQCALMDPMGGASSCAIICNAAGDSSDCPGASTCKDAMQMGAGICTYP